MTLPFQGLTALVTGASGGIGAASARALADSGADLALTDLCFTDLGRGVIDHAKSLGRRVVIEELDITDQSAVERFVARAAESLGGIDGFVSSAVYSDREPFTTANMAGFHKTV